MSTLSPYHLMVRFIPPQRNGNNTLYRLLRAQFNALLPRGALALRTSSSLQASASERCFLCGRQHHVGFADSAAVPLGLPAQHHAGIVGPAVVPVGIPTEANLQQNAAAEQVSGVEVSPVYRQFIHSLHHSFVHSVILSFISSSIISFFRSFIQYVTTLGSDVCSPE